MKDRRLQVFRGALDALIESLDAHVRVTRWNDVEAPPEPLRAAATKLSERLGTAGRLTSGTFVGTPTDSTRVRALCASMKQLDGAYLAYRKRLEYTPGEEKDAVAALECEIAEAVAGAARA
jgi:hypothetical protein